MKGLAIYDEDVAEILRDCCFCSIRRASHVETVLNLPPETRARLPEDTDPSLWWVDFSPIGKDTLLGPFVSRQRALDEEKSWLETQMKNSSGIVTAEAAFS